MTNRNAWDVRVFNNLYRVNPKEAFIYRKNTLGDEIPEEYRDNLEKIEVEEKSNLKNGDLSNSKEKNDISYTREDLISILEKNGIKYVKNSKTETLLQKCIENKLI